MKAFPVLLAGLFAATGAVAQVNLGIGADAGVSVGVPGVSIGGALNAGMDAAGRLGGGAAAVGSGSARFDVNAAGRLTDGQEAQHRPADMQRERPARQRARAGGSAEAAATIVEPAVGIGLDTRLEGAAGAGTAVRR